MSTTPQLAEDIGEDIRLPIVPLQTLLSESVRQHPDALALICSHQPPGFLQVSGSSSNHTCLKWTYTQLHSTAQHVASYLHKSGVRRGMRIAACLYNGAQFAIGLWAAALLGCAFAPINPNFVDKGDDLDYMLGVVEPSVLLIWDARMAKAVTDAVSETIMERLLVKVICNKLLDDANDAPPDWTLLWDITGSGTDPPQMPSTEDTKADLDDLAVVVFTSGTTSRPKGVKQRNRTLVAGVRSATQGLALDPSRSSCNNLPTFHIFGIMYSLNFWSSNGAVCYPSETFDPAAALKSIEDERLTNLPGVPSMLHALMNHPSATKTKTDSILEIDLSASVILPETIAEIGRRLGVKKIAASFGMSEGVPITTTPYRNLPHPYSKSMVTSGRCCPGARIRVCEPNTRNVLPRGKSGELHNGGPMVVDGYLGAAEGNFYSDSGTSWIVTGDLGMMQPDGEIHVLGRYKDVIIRAGENISPATIEAVLDSMPGVSSQVVGIDDEIAGEVPLAILQQTNGSLDDGIKDEMNALIAEKLGTSRVPADIISIRDLNLEEFPRTDSGKIQKTELRRLVGASYLKPNGHSSNLSESRASIQDALHRIWSKLLGVSTNRLTVTTPIEGFADSITVLRAISKIKQETGYSMSMQDVRDAPTIEQQRQLLGTRGKQTTANVPVPEKQRQGPPTIEDMVHVRDDPTKLAEVQETFNSIASPLGLKWEQDVEDVMPVWDFGQILLKRLRPQSWNHRHAFVTTGASGKRLRRALEQTLGHHPMLRTLAIQPPGSPLLHVVIRPSRKWFQVAIIEVDSVKAADDLRELLLNDPELDYAAAPGPLFRAIIAPIAGTDEAGLVYQAQHSCFDGLSIPNFIEDLNAFLMHGENADVAIRTPYKPWADAYYLHRTSVPARTDCRFHVQRLQGLGKLKESLWPVQKAPQWFKGHFDKSQTDFAGRELLDGDESIGVDGITKQTQLPHLQQLKTEHGLSAPAILKAALAILNSHYTGQNIAVFTNYEAARVWPFQQSWIADQLPNAMDINGPTFEAVLNKIEIDSDESCVQLMRSVHQEQKLLTRHAHAPLLAIQAELGAEDGNQLIDTMRRQIFNWLPGLQGEVAAAKAADAEKEGTLKRVQMQSRSDVGLLWNCGMIDDKTFHMTASYDDAQLRKAEVEEAVERLFSIATWMTLPENWDKPVASCPWL